MSKPSLCIPVSVLCGLFALWACRTEEEGPVVKIDGSSTVFPLTEAMAESFEKRQPVKVDVRTALTVTLGISGTGGGFRQLCSKQSDVVNASRPINASERESCAKLGVEYVELPVAYDGIAVVVNAGNSWAASLAVDELKRIWEPSAQGKVIKWSDIRAEWPNEPLRLFGAGTDSGTYDGFAEAIVQGSVLRGDYAASEDDDWLVEAVAAERGALGFFGYSYLRKGQNRLKAVAVDDRRSDNGDGPIAPTAETVRAGTYQPLSRPLFIYVSTASLRRREVELFVSYYLMNGGRFADRQGYVALPQEAYVLAQRRLNARRAGSVFSESDERVGISIDMLLEKQRARAR